MTTPQSPSFRRFRSLGRRNLPKIPQIQSLPSELRRGIETVSAVLPFRVNQYVVDELIDWERIPEDPIFQLTFPQKGMLEARDYQRVERMVRAGASESDMAPVVRKIQEKMNPHPAGQMELNVPRDGEEPVEGVQHKYRETALFFPRAGQTCHAYCTYCFRWAQFVGLEDLRFAAKESDTLVRYLQRHPEVTDVLVTGGDPLVMSTRVLRRYLEPLLQIETLRSIRIGTKAPAYWPFRFTEGEDADDLLRFFEEIRARGKNVALMAHYSHPHELQTEAGERALRRIVSSGTTVRCQAPVIAKVNDSARTWSELWRLQVQMGAVPYYMFVERDTGPRGYFELPLARAYRIFHEAWSRVSGLGRTVRGPSMSATPGKVLVDGITRIHGEQVMALRFLQARRPEWTRRLFFARYDESATWLDDLEPAFGEREFFFEEGMRRLEQERASGGDDDSVEAA